MKKGNSNAKGARLIFGKWYLWKEVEQTKCLVFDNGKIESRREFFYIAAAASLPPINCVEFDGKWYEKLYAEMKSILGWHSVKTEGA